MIKNYRIAILAILAILATLGCTPAHKAEDAHDEHDHDHDHEHAELIELSDSQAERFGVKVDTVYPAPFATVIRAVGVIERSAADAADAVAPTAGVVRLRVGKGSTVARGQVIATVDPSGVSGGDQNRAARAAVEAAQREVDRLTPLYNDRLVTAATYNAALAELEQARAAYSGGSTNVVAPIAGIITSVEAVDGSYVQPGQPVAAVSADSQLTLHAEVPAERYAELAAVKDARIGSFTLSEHGGKKSGVSAENGYGCVFFTFSGDGIIAPGFGGEVYLLGAERPDVISVPLDAVVELQGEYFVFTRHSPGHYEKHAVKLGASDGRSVEILEGLAPGQPVVTAAATTVRLAEASGAIPEGHSHQH